MPCHCAVRLCVATLAAGALSGCAGLSSVAPEAVGLGAGAGAGVLTANPLIGVAVGLGTRLATAEAIDAVQSSHQRELQQAIASAAGAEAVGGAARWSSEPSSVNRLLFGTTTGSVQVAREFGGRIRCREILYTVGDDGGALGLVDTVETDVESAVIPGETAPAPASDAGQAAVHDVDAAQSVVPAGSADTGIADHGVADDGVADPRTAPAGEASAGSEAAEHPPPPKNDKPDEPGVLVAVICKGVTQALWHWAVSEPAG